MTIIVCFGACRRPANALRRRWPPRFAQTAREIRGSRPAPLRERARPLRARARAHDASGCRARPWRLGRGYGGGYGGGNVPFR